MFLGIIVNIVVTWIIQKCSDRVKVTTINQPNMYQRWIVRRMLTVTFRRQSPQLMKELEVGTECIQSDLSDLIAEYIGEAEPKKGAC